VFARRPAPVQVNFLGYPGTLGTPHHHYIIADDWIIPEGSEGHYSESVLRLPCYQPNDRKRAVGPRPSRREAGLPEQGFVFSCFNGSQKLTRFTLARWGEILRRVPESVLWMLDHGEEMRANVTAFLEGQGIAPARLVFAPKLANADHLARYPLADLFLDSSPYGAHTTASDALWMGVPVLTFCGRGFATRVCGSLVRAAGLPEMVADGPEDFVERAISLAADTAQLAAIRARLAAGRDSCTLFDMPRFARSLEALFLEMAKRHQAGRTPEPNLTNLPHYLAAGCGFDHEGEEMLARTDYEAAYRARLARMHAREKLPADGRLWSPPAPPRRRAARLR
jgi:predicted O-linked N-acetylglucosamine transferase (SPINDLY family)